MSDLYDGYRRLRFDRPHPRVLRITIDNPGKMNSIPTVGCQKFTVHGHNVSLICFALADNKIVHLFVVDRSALKDAPPVNVPQFARHDDWSTASWSDNTHSYMMATQAGADTLKQLL